MTQLNRLSGTLPHGLTSIGESLARDLLCHIESNRFSGSIPDAVGTWGIFVASDNMFFGGVGDTILPPVFIANNNQLTGTLPPLEFLALALAGNMLEGTVPTFGSRLILLDLTGQAGQIRGLEGPLPSVSTTPLARLCLSHQNLRGIIPLFATTLALLSLYDNGFKAFSGASFMDNGFVLQHNNELSCRVPKCNNTAVNLSMSGLGNELRRPGKAFPAWISPMEQDSFFWTSSHEDLPVLVKFFAGSSFVAIAIAAQIIDGRLLRIMAATGPSKHCRLVSLCARLINCIARASLVRVVFLMCLPGWELYRRCPRALAVASACLRGSTVTHIMALALWCHLCFYSNAARCLKIEEGVVGRAAQRGKTSRARSWPAWILLTMMLSSLSILRQAEKCVPGLIEGGRCWLPAFNSGIGCVQGLLSSFVIPHLAQELTQQECVFTSVANILTNCLIPDAVIACLDSRCVGYWVSLWRPCRRNPEQFHQIIACNRYDWSGYGPYGF